MQLAVLISATVNGGVVLKPQLSGPEGFATTERWRLPKVTPGPELRLRGRRQRRQRQCRLRPRGAVAGKTGTCSALGWFASYAPADRPELVVVAFLKRGSGQGASAVAGRIFRQPSGGGAAAAAGASTRSRAAQG